MSIVFLLGSGFSAAANPHGRRKGVGRAPQYPVMRDLAELCFPSGYDLGRGIEYAFAAARERNDPGPIDRLVDVIQDADHYIGSSAAEDRGSSFQKLLDRFPGVDFLNFNYDCLVELLLLKRGLWNPVDGFAVRAEAETPPASGGMENRPSCSCVLHLHGSLYLYASEVDFVPDERTNITWLKPRSRPAYVFDPDALAGSFLPYQSGQQGLAYRLPPERIIAPVPDKGTALLQGYVREIYTAAQERLSQAQLLVAIGYNFSDTDRASFDRLLAALRHGVRAVVVSPNATEIVGRLRLLYPAITWLDFASTLQEWVDDGFPGSAGAV